MGSFSQQEKQQPTMVIGGNGVVWWPVGDKVSIVLRLQYSTLGLLVGGCGRTSVSFVWTRVEVCVEQWMREAERGKCDASYAFCLFRQQNL